MDDLDRALIAAWWRAWERCRADPSEARRRWVRASSSVTLNAPSRAWCIGIRASDTRISGAYGASKWEAAREPHVVRLGVQDILEWCGPVRVPYPGRPIDEVAELLGRHVETVRRWLPMKQGRSREDRLNRRVTRDKDYPPAGVVETGAPGAGQFRGWGVRFVPPKAVGRHQGAGVPIVWCDRPIDPGHQGGAPPSPWWGSLWERLAARFAEEWERRHTGTEVPEPLDAEYSGPDVLAAERVPRWIARRRTAHGPPSREFRGWEWVCPGLPKNRAKPRAASAVLGVDRDARPPMTSAALHGGGCGRRAQVLVCPFPAWTIGEYLADRPEVAAGLDVGEATRWVPGVSGVPGVAATVSMPWGGERPPMASAALYGGRFACVKCWGVRNVTQRGPGGWNEFVARISGGLLYGRDVPKPGGVFEEEDHDAADEAGAPGRAAATSGVETAQAVSRA